MRVLVSGSSGLVGSALMPALVAAGHEVGRLARANAAAGPHDVRWDPTTGHIDDQHLEGVDVVVHLAGENIAAGRWSQWRKESIRKSRVEGTRLVAGALAKLKRQPQVMVSASAIGYYGDRGDEVLRETSGRGHGFLPAVCVAWEAQTEPAEARGIRVVHLRFGVILSEKGGALRRMLVPFRLGVGGIVGSGRQWVSWIAIDDAVGAIQHALATTALRGAVNVVAPEPATNLEFTRALGRVLGRPTVFPLPALAARLAFGELADAVLLASTRVVPDALLASGYRFRHLILEGALRHVLGR